MLESIPVRYGPHSSSSLSISTLMSFRIGSSSKSNSGLLIDNESLLLRRSARRFRLLIPVPKKLGWRGCDGIRLELLSGVYIYLI